MRGTPLADLYGRHPGRFIPTGAGNTATPPDSRAARTVHPHGCGEHTETDLITQAEFGSSPRVRGTHAASLVALVARSGSSPRVRGTPTRANAGQRQVRFIPTGAGNTRRPGMPVSGSTVHPHGCGEHGSSVQNAITWSGSSPRVRGTRLQRPECHHLVRFIPTGAGNTWSRPRHSRLTAGSSPRVRGTHPVVLQPQEEYRFIPTGAGNTS